MRRVSSRSAAMNLKSWRRQHVISVNIIVEICGVASVGDEFEIVAKTTTLFRQHRRGDLFCGERTSNDGR
ncbi:hypothetical protein A2U01_0012585, partial [Trifolium medium]|nr:hypothetical protein [Trifolium medium]